MIAIDPGVAGGFAIALPGNAATAFPMPKTDGEILKLLEFAMAGGATTAYLEDVVLFTGSNMPGSSGIKYGASWGTIKGMLLALKFRIILVRPQTWIKILGLGTSKGSTKTEWKNKLKQRAEQLYPQLNVTLATADALLILEAAKRGSLG